MRHPPIRPGVPIACGNPDSGPGGARRALRLGGSGLSVRLRRLGRRGQPPAAAEHPAKPEHRRLSVLDRRRIPGRHAAVSRRNKGVL